MVYEYTFKSSVRDKNLQSVLDEYAKGGWRMINVIPNSINGTSMGVYHLVWEREVAAG